MIKKLDKYVLYHFVQMLFATFFISSFILLMQFLWSHINDIIGKGVDFIVIAEFFFYSFLSVIPLSLPLAVLLASLIVFGNFGEKMELTAMKAAGISLFRIMTPITLLIIGICIGAFFFSNNVLPISQKKLWTLIFSLRQTSPELEIPEGEFYDGIKGYNIYVRHKDRDKKLLKEVMIYDFSDGFRNASVTVADSARMKMADDKTFLLITLYNGEAFENLKKQEEYETAQNVPYRREQFRQKQFVIDFDANFARMDETVMDDDYDAKNMARLDRSIDSMNLHIDSIKMAFSKNYARSHFLDRRFHPGLRIDTFSSNVQNYNTYLSHLTEDELQHAYNIARIESQIVRDEVNNQMMYQEAEEYYVIRHKIAWHRKLTLPFACLIFFFIGAPLGAIIRKGGLGVPIVISVGLFIVYYVIDNSGFKLAREDVWEVWKGIWLSSVCLLPIGIFFTYKAAKDSPIFNSEAYIIVFGKIKKFFKRKEK